MTPWGTAADWLCLLRFTSRPYMLKTLELLDANAPRIAEQVRRELGNRQKHSPTAAPSGSERNSTSYQRNGGGGLGVGGRGGDREESDGDGKETRMEDEPTEGGRRLAGVED